MKRMLPLIFAGFVGGLIAIFAMQWSGYGSETVGAANRSPKAFLTNNPVEASGGVSDFVDAARKVTPAVVHIYAEESRSLAEQRGQQRSRRGTDLFDLWGLDDFFGGHEGLYHPRQGTGSGVIISEDGYIVTNNHVVEYADEIRVSLSDKREFVATKVGTDPSTDLALLKIEAEHLTAATFADSEEVQVGQWTAAVGNPFSYLTSTVTAGIVSAKGRDLDIIQGRKAIEAFIQTDAAVNPGNSGGALVNTEGEVIGINTAIATPTGVYAGYSFAIPSNLVLRVVGEIRENGDIERGQLGVRGYSIDNEIKNEFNLSVSEGFYIASVDNRSGAQFAGVLPGDIIVGVNDRRVRNYDDLVKEMQFAKVGETIHLKLLRKNKEIDIPVKLKKGI